MEGIDYQFRKPFGTISEVYPGIVRINKVYAIKELNWSKWGLCEEDGKVRGMRLEEVT